MNIEMTIIGRICNLTDNASDFFRVAIEYLVEPLQRWAMHANHSHKPWFPARFRQASPFETRCLAPSPLVMCCVLGP